MNEPVRILHLAKYYTPDQGGMESVTQVLAEGICDRAYEVEVQTTGCSQATATFVKTQVNWVR